MKRLVALLAVCLTLLGINAAQASGQPPQLTSHAAPFELSELLNHRGEIMLLIDPQDGRILWANRAAAVFYGYSEIRLRSLNIGDLMATPLEQIAAEMRTAQEQGVDRYRVKHRDSSGREIDVQVSAYPVTYKGRAALLTIVYDATELAALEANHLRLSGNIVWVSAAAIGLMAILLMVTMHGRAKVRRAYQRLETTDALRNAFFEASDDIMYLKDDELKYLFVNRGVEKLYSRPADKIVGRDDYELSSKAFADLRARSDLAVVATKAPVHDEIEWDGRSFSSVKFPVELPDGGMGVGAIAREVTRERAEEKRRAMMYRRHKILADVMARSFRSADEQLSYALGEALALTGSSCGYIYRYDHEARTFSLECWTGGPLGVEHDWVPRAAFSLDEGGVWTEVVGGGEPLILNDLYPRDSAWLGCPSNCARCRRFAAVPVIFDEWIVAVVGVGQKMTDYDELDASELTILMSSVWNAVRRRETEERMNFERTRYLKTLVSIGDGVLVVDGEGRIEILNPVAERLSGWTSAEAAGHHYRDVLAIEHEEPDGHVDDVIAAALTQGEVQELSNHAVLISRQGARCNLEDSAAPIHGEDGRVEGVVMVFRDVTQRKEQRKRIEYLSFHDALTGLYNRRFFNEELRRLDTARNLPLAIIMGDVNGLKLTNDIFGHAAGDMLLQRIAQVFKRVCRADDIVARWGGDEFVLLLPKTEKVTASDIVARIKEEFSKERIQAIKGSISMGIAVKQAAEEDIGQVLSAAEEIMYNNKVLERDEARSSTIGEILRTLHAESPCERDHANQVSALCVSLGRAMGLPPEELHKLREIGRLHDIGKITLDREALRGTGELSERQIGEIRRHPIVGYRLLSTFDDTMDLAPAVLAHHEHWDGSGYPKGLAGEEIPLGARILSICEVYERRMWEAGDDVQVRNRVLAYIRAQAGTRFEPRLAEIFADMIEHERQGETT